MNFWAEELPYFSRSELACKGAGIIKLDIRFASRLPALREEWGRPLNPNSICRTPQYNAKVRGHPRSMHLTENPKWPTWGCMGGDFQWRDWPTDRKLAFARLAWRMGWSIGLHDGMCHVDRRKDLELPSLPQHIFLYGEWSNQFSPYDIRS